MRVGPGGRLSTKELMLLNCGAREDSWTEERSNQSILKEINLEYSLEWLMLKLKLQYFGHLMRRANSLEKTLMLQRIWRHEEKGATEDEMVGWQHRLNWHELEQTPGDGQGQGSLAYCSPWSRKELDTTEQLNNNNNWIAVESVWRFMPMNGPWSTEIYKGQITSKPGKN